MKVNVGAVVLEIPVRTQRCSNVYTTSITLRRRRMNVKVLDPLIKNFICLFICLICPKANIHPGKFQPVRYGMIHFLLFSEYIFCSRKEKILKTKRGGGRSPQPLKNLSGIGLRSTYKKLYFFLLSFLQLAFTLFVC